MIVSVLLDINTDLFCICNDVKATGLNHSKFFSEKGYGSKYYNNPRASATDREYT